MRIATRQGQLAVLAFCLLAASGTALAGPNATITNGAVQLRESYPTFSTSTLWQFQLTAGRVVTTIPKETRVEVSARRIIKTQEWFAVTYAAGANTFKGWVYAGEVGTRKYVRLDQGVEKRLSVATGRSGLAPDGAWGDPILSLFFPIVHAQTSSEVVVPPPVATNLVATLLLSLAHVVIFLGALFCTKKWIFTSNKYCFLTALCILLILGFLSESVFTGIVAKALTAG